MSKGTVILSTTDGGDYIPYLEYCQKAWNKLGWETLTFYLGKLPPTSTKENRIIEISKKYLKFGYREATLVQVSRLFGGHYCDGMVMTGDVDMMPMADYWGPKSNKVTVYGEDLTGRSQFPICYIAMDAQNWRKIIKENNFNELLDKYPNAKSDDFYKWWGVDQEIITERVKKLVPIADLVKIDRGLDGGLAKGRVDRHDWQGTLARKGKKIDAHMPRPFNKMEAIRILNLCEQG